jgi:hypothetical protein
MIKRLSSALLFLYFISVMAGCGSLLPSARQTVKSPWKTFDEAKTTYDKVVLNETTTDDLRKLGFDPFLTPNIKILTYLDIIQRFMFNPSIEKEDLDEGLQVCIGARSGCHAYEVQPRIISSQRLGNVWLDLFNFKRNVQQTGWRFDALVVIVNDVVVYKLWGGDPIVHQNRRTKNPLGPLQTSEGLLIDITKQSSDFQEVSQIPQDISI